MGDGESVGVLSLVLGNTRVGVFLPVLFSSVRGPLCIRLNALGGRVAFARVLFQFVGIRTEINQKRRNESKRASTTEVHAMSPRRGLPSMQ